MKDGSWAKGEMTRFLG